MLFRDLDPADEVGLEGGGLATVCEDPYNRHDSMRLPLSVRQCSQYQPCCQLAFVVSYLGQLPGSLRADRRSSFVCDGLWAAIIVPQVRV